MTLPVINKMRHVLKPEVVDQVMNASADDQTQLHQLLEEEWQTLKYDREMLRETFPDGMFVSPSLSVSLLPLACEIMLAFADALLERLLLVVTM